MVSRQYRSRAFLLLIYAFMVCSIGLRAQVPIEVGSRDRTNSLPDTEGKGLLLAACTQCHSLGPIVFQRKSAEGWETTVRDMISRGAQVRPEEAGPISSYLVRSFGPSPGAPDTNAPKQDAGPAGRGTAANATASFPDGPARAIILTSCTPCHGLDRITDHEKDAAGWNATVKDMVKLGAKVDAEEFNAVVSYLSKNFGKSSSVPGRQPRATGTEEPARTRPADLAETLPDHEGKGLILATCVQCHGLAEITGQRKDAMSWTRTVRDMVSRGAQITSTEAETIASYLARYRGNKTR